MADIFISYSKADRDLALKLASYLESEGWSVWWDKSLKPADTYRDEIMKQLAASRAVIVIWTKNSINSDWVKAEAGRAKADGKLIPVKTADVNYADIPLPFGEQHTENVRATELIRAAVLAQLEKPTVQASPFWQITSAFKSEFLTWMGIIGGAITLFTNLGAVLNLADWARVLVQHWHEWNAAIWTYAFGWTGIHIPNIITPALSFCVCMLMLVVGINLRTKTFASARRYSNLTKLLLFTILNALIVFGLRLLAEKVVDHVFEPNTLHGSIFLWIELQFLATLFILPGFLVFVKKEKIWTLTVSLLMYLFAIILYWIPTEDIYREGLARLADKYDEAFKIGFAYTTYFATIFLPACLVAVVLYTPV